MRQKILLVAGGTGGHLFSAIALAENLVNYLQVEVHLSTDKRCIKYLKKNTNINLHIVDLYINLKTILNKIKVPFLFSVSLFKAFILIRKVKPNIILGFGGYPTFPIMFIGQLLSVPTIICEQNTFLGKTNKFFAKKAKLISLAYKNTQNIPINYLDKVLVTGHFIRNSIKSISEKTNFSDIPFKLLVLGGSQGAKFFSVLVPEAIKILLKKYPGSSIEITQQVLKEDAEVVKKIYNNLKIKSTLSDFFYDIYKHYKNSHLVITRAGATTIAELTQIGLPGIFIPFPFSTNDHQYYNAKSLQDSNCSWYYKEKEVTAEVLADKLYDLIHTPLMLKEASRNLLKRKNNSYEYFINLLLKIVTKGSFQKYSNY